MKKIFEIEWSGEEGAICKATLEAIIYKEYESGRRLQRVKVTELPPKPKIEKIDAIDLYQQREKINEIIEVINETL